MDGGAGGFPTSRGADDLEEFLRQTDKIVAALAAMDADIVGLVELENDETFIVERDLGRKGMPVDGGPSALQDLVMFLNLAVGAGTYDFFFVKRDHHVWEPAETTKEIIVKA